MTHSSVSIPIPTSLFLDVAEKLRSQGRDPDPVGHVMSLIEGWLLQHHSEAPLVTTSNPSVSQNDGYWWKSVYIPNGSLARMTYKGRNYQAVVTQRGFEFEGRALTASEFTFAVTNTARNAWRDIELKFPDATTWVPADSYRASYPK